MAKDDRLPTPDVGLFVTLDKERTKREGGVKGKKFWFVTVIAKDKSGKAQVLQHESHGRIDALGRLDKFQESLMERFIIRGHRPTKEDVR